MRPPVSGIGVVIPARDEEDLLPHALAAIDTARDHLRDALGRAAPWVRVMVVLDSCTDDSAAITRRWADIESTTVAYASVGAARREGIRRLLASCDDDRTVWIANTDADSQVPPHWLLRQWDLAVADVDLMLGTVRPDFDDLSEHQRSRWLATYVSDHGHGYIHGANLGFRSDRYLDAGGFQRVPEHEDVLLVEALRANEARAVAIGDCCVMTSGRGQGRTPGGYASHLRDRLCEEAGSA